MSTSFNDSDLKRIHAKGYEQAVKCSDCSRLFAPDERDAYENHMIDKHNYASSKVKRVANQLEFTNQQRQTVDSRKELQEVLAEL